MNPNPVAKLPPPVVIKQYANDLSKLDEHLQNEMTWVQASYVEQSDKHKIRPPKLKVGDEVWLLRRHIKTTQLSSKLDYKKLGKFKILQKISSNAYKLDLPAFMKIHPVFHISLLEPVASDPLQGQVQPLPPPIIIDNQEIEYEVDEIDDSKVVGKILKYLVSWVGYSDLTWELAANLTNSPSAVKSFHLAYPQKCNGDVSYDEGSLQEVRTVTMTMTDIECLRLI